MIIIISSVLLLFTTYKFIFVFISLQASVLPVKSAGVIPSSVLLLLLRVRPLFSACLENSGKTFRAECHAVSTRRWSCLADRDEQSGARDADERISKSRKNLIKTLTFGVKMSSGSTTLCLNLSPTVRCSRLCWRRISEHWKKQTIATGERTSCSLLCVSEKKWDKILVGNKADVAQECF